MLSCYPKIEILDRRAIFGTPCSKGLKGVQRDKVQQTEIFLEFVSFCEETRPARPITLILSIILLPILLQYELKELEKTSSMIFGNL